MSGFSDAILISSRFCVQENLLLDKTKCLSVCLLTYKLRAVDFFKFRWELVNFQFGNGYQSLGSGTEWNQQFEEDDSQCIDVHLVVIRLAFLLFRCHVRLGANIDRVIHPRSTRS